jgi:hypothetical protein
VGYNETSPERHIISDDVDPEAIVRRHFSTFSMRDLEYDDRIARAGGKPIHQSKRDLLSAFVADIDNRISGEVASMRGRTPARKFQKDIVMVVPGKWSDSLKRLALQVRFFATLNSLLLPVS